MNRYKLRLKFLRQICLLILLTPALFQPLYSLSMYGSLYDPGRELFTIQTRYFDIIYPAQSRNSACYLASFADETYERIHALLESKHPDHITVVITPDAEIQNGMFSPLPYSHIIIMDYQSQAGLFNEKEYLKDEFTHELTHAVSLNIRSGFYEGFSAVFGNWSPNYSMPLFMDEGAAVSFESLNGCGRVNDPAAREEIRQDILENSFKDPAMADGDFDDYPYGYIYYHYGGLFNHYLQAEYGMHAYADLWKENGGALPFTLIFNFEKVYSNSFYKEWVKFKDSIALKAPVETNTNILSPVMQWRREIDSSVFANGKIYFSNGGARRISVYDMDSKKYYYLLETMADLSISEKGDILYLTSETKENEVIKSRTQEYNIRERKFSGRQWKKLGSIARMGGGIAAVRADGHKMDLVYIHDNGEEEVILRGGESVSFDSLAKLNDKEIVFILFEQGRRKIAFYNFETRQVSVLDAAADYIRDLAVYEGKIVFVCNNDDTLYKMGIADSGKLYLQTNLVYGGVFSPFIYRDRIYYRGKFSTGDVFLPYPCQLTNWNGSITNYSLKAWQMPAETAETAPPDLREKPYNGLPYLLPRMWAPYATVSGSSFIPDSVGIYTMMWDPVYQNIFTIYSTFNYMKYFANAWGKWENSALPVNFSLNPYDLLLYFSGVNSYVRQSGVNIDLNHTFYFAPYYFYYITLGLGASYFQIAPDDKKGSPYAWKYYYESLVLSAYTKFLFSSDYIPTYEINNRNNAVYLDYFPGKSVYKAEANINYYPFIINAGLKLYGAYSPSKIFNMASQSFYFGGDHYPAYNEYRSLTNTSGYYLSGELNYLVYLWEIQQGFWLLPFYVRRLNLIAGYRAAYLDGSYFHSLFARLYLENSLFYGKSYGNAYVEGTYAFNTGGWGILFNVEYGL